MMGTLQRELGSLDAIGSWVKILGMVKFSAWFFGQTPVVNGFSETILEVFGPRTGYAGAVRSGRPACPAFQYSVEVEAELELALASLNKSSAH